MRTLSLAWKEIFEPAIIAKENRKVISSNLLSATWILISTLYPEVIFEGNSVFLKLTHGPAPVLCRVEPEEMSADLLALWLLKRLPVHKNADTSGTRAQPSD